MNIIEKLRCFRCWTKDNCSKKKRGKVCIATSRFWKLMGIKGVVLKDE
jgi:hypothetical protein